MGRQKIKHPLLLAFIASSVIMAAVLMAGKHCFQYYSHEAPLPVSGNEDGGAAPDPVEPMFKNRIDILARDTAGRPVGGARVLLLGRESSLVFEATADAEGRALLENIPPGKYTLSGSRGNLICHDPQALDLGAKEKKEAKIELLEGLTLEGQVVGRPENAPASKACISVNAAEKTSDFLCAATGEDGTFSFNPLPPGKYIITASKEGYKTERIPWLELEKDVPITSINIELKKFIKLTGRVASTDGLPVEGAGISLVRANPAKKTSLAPITSFQDIDLPPPLSHPRLISSGHLGIMKGPVPDFADSPTTQFYAADLSSQARQTACACMKHTAGVEENLSAMTDAAGAFVVYADPDTIVDLVISHPEYAPEKVENLDPKTLSKSGGLNITLKKGMDLAGRLVDLDGNPPADAQLWMEMEDFNIVSDVAVDAGGHFTLPCAAGNIVLHANAPGFSPETKKITAQKRLPGDLVEITLVPDEKIITGSVVDNRGFPLFGAKITIRMAGSSEDDIRRIAFSDSDGVFSFVTLPPGDWKIAIDHASYFTLEETIPAWEKEMEFFLQEVGGIFGKVIDDRTYLPVAEFTLILKGEQGSTKSAHFEDGQYVWPDLPAGQAWLEVEAEGYVSQFRELIIPPAEDKRECTLEDVDFWLVPEDG